MPITASYDCGFDRGGAAGDHAPSSPSVLRLSMARRRYRIILLVSCDRPNICFLSLALRNTSRVLSFPVLVAT